MKIQSKIYPTETDLGTYTSNKETEARTNNIKNTSNKHRIYINSTGLMDELTEQEEVKLILMARNGDKGSKQKIMERNIKCVVSIVQDYIDTNMNIVDLIEEGNNGLAQAIEEFNHELGYRFSAYAAWLIRASIENSISKKEVINQ